MAFRGPGWLPGFLSMMVGNLAHPGDGPAVGVVLGVAYRARHHSARVAGFDDLKTIGAAMFYRTDQMDSGMSLGQRVLPPVVQTGGPALRNGLGTGKPGGSTF